MDKPISKRKIQIPSSIKKTFPIVGWGLIIVILIYRPEWLAIAFFVYLAIALLSLYVFMIYFKAKEAKEESGWLFGILTAVGLIIFIAFWYWVASNMDKRLLP